LRGLTSETLATRASARAGYRADNLPASVTSFIGREQEIADVVRLLMTTRLLTIIGTRGIGKTRLALEVAHVVLPSFSDGACLVELALLADASLLAAVMASH
jgi:MoxR-like ATPase